MPKPSGKAPLRTKLSNHAPRSAKIVSRNFSDAALAPTYNLKVGDVDLPDVTLDEIFDFVSQRDYEIFENGLFAREIEEADRQQLEETLLSEKLASARLKSKKNVTQTGSEPTDDAVGADSSADDLPQLLQPGPVEVGRHGRPRPTYGQFYLQRGRGRGRRGRPRGSGISRAEFKQRKVAERESSRATPSSANEQHIEGSDSISEVVSSEPLKRRKIDITSASPARSSVRARTPPKRDPSSSPDILSPPDRVVITPKKPPYLRAPAPASATKSSLSNSASKRRSLAALPPDPALTSAADDDDEDDEDEASSIVSTSSSLSSEAYNLFLTSKRKPPSSGPEPRSPSHQPPPSSSDGSEDEDEEEEEDSFEIEAITEHRLSDPSTHPAHVGRKPVMLYHVKWVGYDELTWEPATSFGDQRVVMQYWARVKEVEEGGGAGGDGAVAVGKGKGRA